LDLTLLPQNWRAIDVSLAIVVPGDVLVVLGIFHTGLNIRCAAAFSPCAAREKPAAASRLEYHRA
jgi:hypothetical protein